MENTTPRSLNGQCASCLLPFNQDPLGANRESDEYCSLCYANGKLTFEGDLTAFRAMCYPGMLEHHIPVWKAKFFLFLIGFAPRWKGEWKFIRGIY